MKITRTLFVVVYKSCACHTNTRNIGGIVAREPLSLEASDARSMSDSINYGQSSSSSSEQREPKLPAEFEDQDVRMVPLKRLGPFVNRWVTKLCVTKKYPMRHWNNAKGSGYLFSVDFADEQGTQIRGTAFKEAADKFTALLQENEWYWVSKASLKFANKKFTSIKNDYEFSLNTDTLIVPCTDDTVGPELADVLYDFIPIAELVELDDDDEIQGLFDVMGAIESIDTLQMVTIRRTNEQCAKRSVLLRDSDANATTIELTLWGEQQCRSIEQAQAAQVLTIKSVRMGEYQGRRTLSSTRSSIVELDADRADVQQFRHTLRENTREQASSEKASSQAVAMEDGDDAGDDDVGDQASVFDNTTVSLSDAKKNVVERFDTIGVTMRPIVYETVAYLKHVARSNGDLFYAACPTKNCNRRVRFDAALGHWTCGKCVEPIREPAHRFIIQALFAYESGDNEASRGEKSCDQWMTVFDRHARALLNISADQAYASGVARVNRACGDAIGTKVQLKVKATVDTYGNETRVRHTVQALRVHERPAL